MVEVLMAMSDAMCRASHDMWIAARYMHFRYRYATWVVPQTAHGPDARAFHGAFVARL